MSKLTRGHSWFALGVLTLANVSGFIDRQILSLLVPAIERDLQISDTQMSYLIGLSFLVFYTVLGIPIARWADRGSRKHIIAGGIALWSVMTMLCGTANTYARLLLARIGVGVGEASLNAPAVSLLSDLFPEDRRASAISVYTLGVFLGSGLAYVIGGAIVGIVSPAAAEGAAATVAIWHWPIIGDVRPWQAVFIMVGAPGLLIALLVLAIREPRRGESGTGAGNAPEASLAASVERQVPIREILAHISRHRRAFLTHHLGFALSATVNYGIAAWLATFLIRTYGWTPTRAGFVQGTLTMTVGVVGTLAGGRVADAFVRRGRSDAPYLVGMIGAGGMLVSATAYPLMPSAGLAVTWLAAVNFFAAFPWGPASASAAAMAPRAMRAQGVALYFLVLNLVSGTLGPTGVALLTDRVFGSPGTVRYSLAVLNVLGMGIALVLFVSGRGSYRRTLSAHE